MTRPGALLEKLGVAWHQVGEEALSLLGEALAARGRRGAVGAARLGSLTPDMAPAPPQPDLAHSALEKLTSVVMQCGRGLDVLAAQRPGQMATLCRKEAAQAPARWAALPGSRVGIHRSGRRWGWDHQIPTENWVRIKLQRRKGEDKVLRRSNEG